MTAAVQSFTSWDRFGPRTYWLKSDWFLRVAIGELKRAEHSHRLARRLKHPERCRNGPNRRE